MMRTTFIAALLSCAPLYGQTARSFHCQAEPRNGGSHALAQLSGRFEQVDARQLLLSYDLQADFACRMGGDCVRHEQLHENGLVNNMRYRPWVHRGYLQFPLSLRDSKVAPQASGGETIALLFPESVMQLDQDTLGGFFTYGHINGIYGETEPMRCETESVPAHATVDSHDFADEAARARVIINEDFAWPRLSLILTPEEAPLGHERAAGQATVSLSKALQSGLIQVLEDMSHDETPLSIAWEAFAAEHSLSSPGAQLPQHLKRGAQNLLRDHLNRESTRLTLYRNRELNPDIFPPEKGESAEENWIFALDIPSLSDHLYWIVVDKQGMSGSYVYGFN